MVRLFVAIDLADASRERLKTICHGLPGARWVKDEQLHLTLRFIGEVDEPLFQDIREVLGGVEAQAFSLQLDGIGCFPPRGRPRIVWAGVAANRELLHLQKKIESVLTREAGLDPEGRKYAPHITLARLKNTPPERVGRYLEEYGLFFCPPFAVDCFSLYSSFLGKNGASHVLEESYPLSGGGKNVDGR
ncbi:MAG: RNA 2',3'-cyclic phosphodiesterase [Thermodesulfobacteriota bacterium]